MPEIDPVSGLPIGYRVDTRGALAPEAITLTGHRGSIERLDCGRHRADLWEAVRGNDGIFTYMAYGPFADGATFFDWLATREESLDPFYYAVITPSGRAVGLAALMAIRPDMRVIEIGNLLLSPQAQRTTLATEAQFLLARYVFDTLGYRRYEWKCDTFNAASRHAALRLGFSFEGIFRDHMIVKGRNRDTAWFAMLAAEWPSRKAALERWLQPDNFYPDATQRRTLRESRNASNAPPWFCETDD
jgi:RimJ/RimL family protein N-acetyltransferase